MMKGIITLCIFLILGCWNESSTSLFSHKDLLYQEQQAILSLSCGVDCFESVFLHRGKDSLFLKVQKHKNEKEAFKRWSQGKADGVEGLYTFSLYSPSIRIHNGILKEFSFVLGQKSPSFYAMFPLKNRILEQRGFIESYMLGVPLRGQFACQGYSEGITLCQSLDQVPQDVWEFWQGQMGCGVVTFPEWSCRKSNTYIYGSIKNKILSLAYGRAEEAKIEEFVKKSHSLNNLQ